MKYKVSIYLKSGAIIEFVCGDFGVTWSKVTGEYLSYSITELERYRNVNIDVSEIAAYTTEEVSE